MLHGHGRYGRERQIRARWTRTAGRFLSDTTPRTSRQLGGGSERRVGGGRRLSDPAEQHLRFGEHVTSRSDARDGQAGCTTLVAGAGPATMNVQITASPTVMEEERAARL